MQGAVKPDEFYGHKHTIEAGRPAILRRNLGNLGNLGNKAIKVVYGEEASDGKSVKTVDVDQARAHAFLPAGCRSPNLARQAITIEKHYGRPMEIEWAKGGDHGRLYIVQARPDTPKSRTCSRKRARS